MATYQITMDVLSQCGLGALMISADGRIMAVNESGDKLLHGQGALLGKTLSEIAEPLCREEDVPLYANVAFGEYLLRCTTPKVEDLPDGCQLIAFREASNDACHDMLMSVLRQMKEALVLCDSQSRVYLLNDAAVRLDAMVTRDVLGESIHDVYEMLDGKEMAIDQVIRSKKAMLDHRQHYKTRYGRVVDSVSNTFPITQNGQVLGAFNILEDWSAISNLQKQIIDLQEKLLSGGAGGKGKSSLSAKYTFKDIIHASTAMDGVVKTCERAAKNDSSVMIYGETGTGKELFAQSIHNASERADGPFLAINCAALPENLLEGILFGVEKGAYTGAERRAGLFEQANHGTLLLDEINSMNINLQAKLLRVLQDGVIRRVGGMTEMPVDVRVLSNINIPPYQAIAENKLRQDLYYRLGVVNIHVPPLRERKEEIALLVKHFIMNYNKKLRKNVKNVDADVLDIFWKYDWPGNVRELQHAIGHAMNILPDELSVITEEYLPEHLRTSWEPVNIQQQIAEPRKQEEGLPQTIYEIERSRVCEALRRSGGNISAAARILQMSRQNLQYRIKRYAIDVDVLLREK